MICWKCKKEIKIEKVFRTTDCPLCGADLHSCKGCKFYSVNSHFDCKETIEAPVSDKEKSNFCEYFVAAAEIEVVDSKKDAAVNSFNALFGEETASKSEKSSKDAFNALFGD